MHCSIPCLSQDSNCRLVYTVTDFIFGRSERFFVVRVFADQPFPWLHVKVNHARIAHACMYTRPLAVAAMNVWLNVALPLKWGQCTHSHTNFCCEISRTIIETQLGKMKKPRLLVRRWNYAYVHALGQCLKQPQNPTPRHGSKKNRGG